MKLTYFLVSEDALLDDRSNKVSIIKIVERLYIEGSKQKIGSTGITWNESKLTAVAAFESEPDEDVTEASFQIGIRTPVREVPAITFGLDFEGKPRSRCYVDLPGLPDDGSGVYIVHLHYSSSISGEQIQDWKIDVRYGSDFDDPEDESEPELLES